MLPSFQDFVDFLDAIRFNLGLARKHPHYDRYSFEEKLEYWAVVWGTAVMVITGFLLWNPISATKLPPWQLDPGSKSRARRRSLAGFSGHSRLAHLQRPYQNI